MKTDTPETKAFMQSLQGHCDSYEVFAQKVEDFTAKLERERNAAIEALENHKALAIHTCSQYCQRPLCVANRRIAEMREVIKEAYKALEDCHVALPDGDDTAWNALSKLQPFIKP